MSTHRLDGATSDFQIFKHDGGRHIIPLDADESTWCQEYDIVKRWSVHNGGFEMAKLIGKYRLLYMAQMLDNVDPE